MAIVITDEYGLTNKKKFPSRDALGFLHADETTSEFKTPGRMLTKSHVPTKGVRDSLR